MIHQVHFRNENLSVHVADGANLRRACLDHGVDPYPAFGGLLSCHGKGFCGTCLVGVDDVSKLSPPTAREARWLARHVPPGTPVRLSCQAEVKGDLIVTTGPRLKPGWRAHTFYSGHVERPWEEVRRASTEPAAGSSS
jgi:ferredoxin